MSDKPSAIEPSWRVGAGVVPEDEVIRRERRWNMVAVLFAVGAVMLGAAVVYCTAGELRDAAKEAKP